MKTRDEIFKFVESRSWYQTIDFGDGVVSKGCDWCGDPAWENIKKLLPDDLTGKRVLDIGCNAGIISVRTAQLGAKVIGIDWSGWRPDWDFQEQRAFVKEVFKDKAQGVLDVTFEQCRMEDYLRKPVGRFDYVLAIASIYYTTTPKETVEAISRITDRVIVRLRDKSKIELYTSLFESCGFTKKLVFREEWWKKLGRDTDDFYLYLYFR